MGKRRIAAKLADLPKILASIAVASGSDKIVSIVVGRARYFNQLVTNPMTAEQILATS